MGRCCNTFRVDLNSLWILPRVFGMPWRKYHQPWKMYLFLKMVIMMRKIFIYEKIYISFFHIMVEIGVNKNEAIYIKIFFCKILWEGAISRKKLACIVYIFVLKSKFDKSAQNYFFYFIKIQQKNSAQISK